MAITKNLVSDYSADPTGVGDVWPKLQSFRTDAAGQDATLNVDPGDYRHDTFSNSGYWATGMSSLVINGTGAYFFEGTGNGPSIAARHFVQIGLDAVGGQSARIKTCYPGATSVELTAASAAAGYISRAVVGQWMCVTGYDIQGIFRSAYGFPHNNHFINYVQITAIDTTNKIISFTPALTNFYSEQWPCFNLGSSSEVDSGGPATVYFLHADFGVTIVSNGLDLNNSNNIRCTGLDVTINGGSYPSGGLPVFPSANRFWRAINHDTSGAGQMELDKLVETAIFDGGASHQFQGQSSSIQNLYVQNTTMDGGLEMGARNGYVENCTIGGGIKIGPTSFGRGELFTCKNTSVAGTVTGGYTLSGPSSEGFQAFASMSNGVITMPIVFDANSVMRAFVPDRYGRNVLFWTGTSGRVIDSFQVLSVTADPWPATDNQSVSTAITITNGLKTMGVAAGIFSASDVGKTILVNAGLSGGSQLRTFITAVSGDTQTVTVYNAFTNTLVASTQTLQWGTCNSYIQTNKTGGLPSASLYTTLGIRVPPARSVSFTNCTNNAALLVNDHPADLSQTGAQNRPLWSYSKRTYDGVTGFSSSQGPNITMYGTITELRINVLKKYDGVGSLTIGLSAADNMPAIINGVMTTYAPRVNLKVVGERIIKPGNVTGLQSGDVVTMPDPVWMVSTFAAGISRNISAEPSGDWPSFTIEMITDQGFSTGPTAVVPLCLRLRAA